jgi:LysM repeat protein
MQATLTILALLTVTSVLTAEPLTLNVEKGDTLYSIGREYDVPVDRLIEANGIINPRQLKQGMRIVVPNTYVVQSGDTLYSLARRHDTTVKRLCELNGIEPDALLQIGTVIRLPAAEGEEEASTRLAEQNPEPAEQEEGEREKQVLEERKKQDARETPVRPAR